MRRALLARGAKRLKRTPFRGAKPRKAKTLWRSGRVILGRAAMATLRFAAYERSGGECECWRIPGQTPCRRKVTWNNGHLHHVTPRGAGGSDVYGNVAYIAPACHRALHGEPQWSRSTA